MQLHNYELSLIVLYLCLSLAATNNLAAGATFGKNFDFKIRRDHGKHSYEHLVYESVDDKSLSWEIYQKSTKNILHEIKGYNNLGYPFVIKCLCV